MKISPFSVNVHWDKRYPKAGTNDCPLQLFINLKTVQFKVGIRLYCTEKEFHALNSKGGSLGIKELRRKVEDYVRKAELILSKLPKLTRESFQRLFKSETDLALSHKTAVGFLFEEYSEQLMKEDRIRTATNCMQAYKSFKQYKSALFFEDIDEVFLKGYMAWMRSKGCSTATGQIYMRNLRMIFNKAIREGYISERLYPFKSYAIGTSAKSKAVLYPEHIKKLWEFQPNSLREKRAKDLWFFCYLCNGMNFKDAVYLKNKNIKGDKISFVREKTKRTNTVSEKEINVFFHRETKRIIRQWGYNSKDHEDYVFPYLNSSTTELEREKRLKTIKRVTNKSLNKIGASLKLPERLCLNLARHSFATMLKLNGTPLSFISDAMGHANITTTEHYLKSIQDKNVKTISDTLLNF
jgi:integrase/recombinase XerD